MIFRSILVSTILLVSLLISSCGSKKQANCDAYGLIDCNKAKKIDKKAK
jgi:hypothetical protein